MGKMTILDAARAAYEGYSAHTGGKNFDGCDMTRWEDLDRKIQRAWAAAFKAGFDHFIEQTDALRQVFED